MGAGHYPPSHSTAGGLTATLGARHQGKIAYVHFRNVVGQVPNYKEVFIDEGAPHDRSNLLSISSLS